jgi:PAS domain S-box-containing protein
MSGHELDRYWETVVNTIQDGIMIVNTSGAIVSVNRAFEAITGFSREELIGKPCDIMGCDVCLQKRESAKGHWCGLFEVGQMSTTRCTIRGKGGNIIYAIRNSSLLQDADGNIIGAVGTVTDVTELIEKKNQLEAFRRELRSRDGFHGIIGVSPAMRQVFALIENAAQSDAPVIIFGESGTGKELISRAIHELGTRKEKPFVKVNCASLTETLLESELFGHVRGAYTGAYRDRVGRFEKAHGGDIFLDEIGDLPLSTQVKLLRVLEEKTIERVGASSAIPADVRIISATNRDLLQLVEIGAFRKDFYFRINVIPIHLPPLKERREDIPLLAESFFRNIQLKSGKPIEGIGNETMDALMAYGWPGNVRELKSAFEYAFVTCHKGVILPHHLPAFIYSGKRIPAPPSRASFSSKAIEKQELLDALEKCDGNQSNAAKMLGVSRVTVWNRMKRHGISAKRKYEAN